MEPILKRGFDKSLRYEIKDYKIGEKIPIIFDPMFKTMFNNERRKKYTAYFLSDVLNKDYNEILNNIKFESEKLDREKVLESEKQVDFVCKIDGEIWNIEMNNNPSAASLKRNISYMNNLYDRRKRGDSYNYNKVIQININNFNFKDNTKVIDEFYFKNNSNEILTDDLKIIYIYLPLIRKKFYNKEKLTLFEKILLIANEKSSKNLEMIYKGDDIMKEYVKDASDASEDEEIIGLYDRKEYEEWLRKAEKQEAVEEGKIEAAKSFLKNGVSKEIIAKSLEMDLEKVEKLEKEVL